MHEYHLLKDYAPWNQLIVRIKLVTLVRSLSHDCTLPVPTCNIHSCLCPTVRSHIYQIFMNYEAHKYQMLLKYTRTMHVYCNTQVGSRKALLPRKSNKYYIVCMCVCVCVCFCSLSYPACNAHAPYYIGISVSLALPYSVFSHYSLTVWRREFSLKF